MNHCTVSSVYSVLPQKVSMDFGSVGSDVGSLHSGASSIAPGMWVISSLLTGNTVVAF